MSLRGSGRAFLAFDFGAVSVCHRFPLEVEMAELPGISQALYGNPGLLEDARAAVRERMESLGDAVKEPALQPPLEDYVVFRLASPIAPETPSSWLEAHAREGIARLLAGATNPVKLVGDQYLARMYRKVATRFHLGEWGAAVDRKLEALDSAYQKLTGRDATRRLEALEWIIIVPIALSIAIYLVPLP